MKIMEIKLKQNQNLHFRSAQKVIKQQVQRLQRLKVQEVDKHLLQELVDVLMLVGMKMNQIQKPILMLN